MMIFNLFKRDFIIFKYNKMNICMIIPARYNSSRLPGKPLLKINDKTIIKHVFEQVKKCKIKSDIYVTTDDDRIINEIGKKNCIKVTNECLNGTERICYALQKIKKHYDIIVNIQGDEPFIDPKNIEYAVDKFKEYYEDEYMVCTTIHNILDKDEAINKNIGKLILDNKNNIIYCSRSVIPGNKTGILSDINYLQHIGVFVYKIDYLKKYINTENTLCMLEEDIEWLKIVEMGYKIKSFIIPYKHEIGINTNEDYQYLKKKYEIKSQ